jgi:hypothetical protein
MKANSLKYCLDLVTCLQWYLMLAKPQIQGTKNLGLTKGIKISSSKGMAYLFERVHFFIIW